ncbi:MAG TPA: metallophosphoesterase [Roseiflexaceae bacterium]|nr:metallophosphoesterase [Roseiflexaceae bacterium]
MSSDTPTPAENPPRAFRRARSGRYRDEVPDGRRGDLLFGRGWLAAGALGAGLGLLGLRRYRRAALLGLGAAGLLGGIYTTLVEPRRPRLERLTLHLPGLPPALDGLRIGQISDSHLGMPHAAGNLAWAAAQMRREQPDLLALTGDFVSLHTALPHLGPLLRGLDAPLGVYAVPGNHDYWEGLEELHAVLAPLGVQLLLNEHRRLLWRGGELWLAGVDDIWEGEADLASALRGVPPDAFTLLLCHAPDAADEAARLGVALQLSGHTHGGHLRLPLIGPAARPRYGVTYVAGRYQIGGMELYVSRGLGGLPARFGCPPEAAVFTLRTA